MNAKQLFLTTIGLAVASSCALAGGTLHRTDWDDELAARPTPGSQVTREQVVARLKAPADPRLIGPLRSRNYNPYGTELMRDPLYTRDEVRAGVLQARSEHTLRPAGEAGDQYTAASPRRAAPGFLAGRSHSNGG